MTSPYITEAIRACALPIRVTCKNAVPHREGLAFFIKDPRGDTRFATEPEIATHAYRTLRDWLLAEEMKG